MKFEFEITFEDGFCIVLPVEKINIRHAVEWMSQHYPDAEMKLIKVKNE